MKTSTTPTAAAPRADVAQARPPADIHALTSTDPADVHHTADVTDPGYPRRRGNSTYHAVRAVAYLWNLRLAHLRIN